MRISIILTLLFLMVQAAYSDDTRLLYEKTLQTESGKELNVSLFAGSITINTWSNTSEVNVKFYGNDEAQDKLVFSADNIETGVKVEAMKKGSDNIKNLNIKTEILIPSRYDVKLFTSGGNITVNDITGKMEANTSGGNITSNRTTGNIEAYTSGGNVVVNDNKGDISISTAGGSINVNTFNGNVDASTMGGHITLKGSNGKIEASTAGGNISIDYIGKNMGVDISTMGGNITATLPDDFNADAELGTLAGKIKCDFTEVNKKSKISNHIKTKFNSGGEKFNCTTTAGNIIVIKR